jgi:hypothetical protein
MVKYKLVGEDKERAVEGYNRATPYYKTKSAAKSAWTHNILKYEVSEGRVEYAYLATMELNEVDREYLINKKE